MLVGHQSNVLVRVVADDLEGCIQDCIQDCVQDCVQDSIQDSTHCCNLQVVTLITFKSHSIARYLAVVSCFELPNALHCQLHALHWQLHRMPQAPRSVRD